MTMIAQARARGICQSCRYDLQIFFERGFCNPIPGRKNRPTHLRRTLQPKVNKQRFSNRPNPLAFPTNFQSESPAHQYQDALATADDHTAAQRAVIEQLEKELGIPLEQAIEEDKVSAELVSKRFNDALNNIVSLRENVEDPPDSVAILRDAGATIDDIIREARQVHGDVLPGGILNDEEYSLYRRLYGEPAKEVEDMELGEIDQDRGANTQQNQLLSADGEEIQFRSYSSSLREMNGTEDNRSTLSSRDLRRARARELAQSLGGSIMEEDPIDEMEDDEESSTHRSHPLTSAGRFSTDPKTVFLPKDAFVKPVERIMTNFSNKHLKEMCEKTFGGPGLPTSPLTPRSGRAKQHTPIPLDVTQNIMGEMESNAFITAIMPPTYASVFSVLVETRKRLGSTWLSNVLARPGGPRVLDAGSGGVGVIAWREIVQAHWDSLHTSDKKSPSPPASKSVVLTGSDGLRHRAAEMLDNTTFIPRLPDYVHTRGTKTMEDDRPAQQRKQFDVIIASHSLFGLGEDWMRKQHVQNLWSMLSDQGGVLILVEKGVPRGFEAIASAREMLLDRYIAVPEGHTTHFSQSHVKQLDDEGIHKREKSMIVAPCTNHEKCPMYTTPGLSRGRKDICSFQQRYIRPPFLQRILGAKDRNHDDVDFSYLSVMKGEDLRLKDIRGWDQIIDPLSAPVHSDPAELGQKHQLFSHKSNEGFAHLIPDSSDADSPTKQGQIKDLGQLPTFRDLPRIVYPPIKRRGHVIMDLCTPTGKIERWTVPRSFSKVAYRDARKSKWGDLWALGAKTCIDRNLNLGVSERDIFSKDGKLFEGKIRGGKERLKMKALQMAEKREEERMDDLIAQRDLMDAINEEVEAEAEAMMEPENDRPTTIKPMNNRERKAARKALREAKRQTPSERSDPDTTSYDPSSLNGADHSDRQSVVNEQLNEQAMGEWQTAFDEMSQPGKGKKGGAYGSLGSSSKSAKYDQKNRDKTGEFVRR